MSNLRKLLFVGALVSLMAIAGCAGTGTDGDSSNADGETFQIGYIGPLTGGLASVGQDDRNAVEMYIKENPVWAGRTVQLIAEDGQCDGQPAANAAQKLVNVDGVSVILGAGCSGETLAAAPITEAGGVLLFSSVSTSPEVTGAGDFVFRNAPSDATSTTVMADELAAQYTKVAVLSELNDFAAAYREGLVAKLEERGVEVVVDETYNSEATDFKTALQKVADSGAEVLANLSGTAVTGGFITKQAAELGLGLPVYGPDTLSGSEYVEIAGASAEGTFVVLVSADRSQSDVDDFLNRFAEEYRPAAAEAYVLASYDRAAILHQAVEEVGFEAEALRDYLYQMPVYEGLAGATEFDENGDSSLLPLVLVYQDGKLVTQSN